MVHVISNVVLQLSCRHPILLTWYVHANVHQSRWIPSTLIITDCSSLVWWHFPNHAILFDGVFEFIWGSSQGRLKSQAHAGWKSFGVVIHFIWRRFQIYMRLQWNPFLVLHVPNCGFESGFEIRTHGAETYLKFKEAKKDLPYNRCWLNLKSICVPWGLRPRRTRFGV